MICLIGTVLKERYCVIERIGHGGGGSLYLARDMELGMFRAVKEMPLAKKKEAILMQRLEHPAIPKIVDYMETEEYCYLIMEYIKGQSLEELLCSGENFSIQETLTRGREIARVLGYLHSRKPPVCYGDLKPDNLMISETGHLYLVDLGSAMSDHGKRKQICEGTKGYAAPEQYQGYLSPKSDIYALGKTLEKLCGKKKWQCFLYPEFFWFLFRCTRKQEKYRYSDMSAVQKRIRKLENRYQTVTWRKCFLEVFTVGFLIGALFLTAGLLKQEAFSVVIAEVTDLYYEARQYPEASKNRKRYCTTAEKKLQNLNRNYRGKEQQRRIELMLAWNAELLLEPEKAALYYENLLLYDEEYRTAYGEYGMFLLRIGQKEASRKLWEDYKKKEKAELLEEGESRNLKLWEEINEEKTKE